MTATLTAPATWYLVAGNNDTYWRGTVPAKAVGAKVIKIPHEDGERIVAEPNLDSPFRWYQTEDGSAYPDHEGVAVWGRPDAARSVHALSMYSNGHRIVAEVDDNYTADRKFNIFQRTHWTGGERESFLSALSMYDAIITTTRWLRDEYVRALRENAKAVGKKLIRPEMHVVGNHVDPVDWPEPAPKSDRLRIGWMGSDSHRLHDMHLIYRVCKWASEEGHEVIFIGSDPGWRWAHSNIATRKTFEHNFEYEHIPWVDPSKYARAAYPLDIALVPLARNKFNLGKSDVKFLEMTMSGAAVVASNIEVYDSIEHGTTGLLAGSDSEFLHMTKQLVANPRLRRELVEAATEYVKSERLIGQHAGEWREAITGSRDEQD